MTASSTPMDQTLKDGSLQWLERYRAATDAQRERLGGQVEALTALCSSVADEAWLDVVIQNRDTTTPIALVTQRADLAYAETQALLLTGVRS